MKPVMFISNGYTTRSRRVVGLTTSMMLAALSGYVYFTPSVSAEETAPQSARPAVEAPKEESQPWLGVATKRLPRIVAEHLGLAPGTGLSVEMVVPDSPAARAGLQKDDVLTTYGDQKLMLPDQLSTLVKTSEVGQTVALAVLRDGKSMPIQAVLGARPAEYAQQGPQAKEDEDPALAGGGAGSGGFEDLEAMLGGALEGGNLADMETSIQRMREHVERMQKEMMRDGVPGGVHAQVFRLDQGRVQIHDGQGSISIEKKDGKMTLTAKDKEGNVQYEGPYGTDEEKAKVPDNIRKRADRFAFEDAGKAMPDLMMPKIEGDVNPGDQVD